LGSVKGNQFVTIFEKMRFDAASLEYNQAQHLPMDEVAQRIRWLCALGEGFCAFLQEILSDDELSNDAMRKLIHEFLMDADVLIQHVPGDIDERDRDDLGSPFAEYV
jgi:hypothetical protein